MSVVIVGGNECMVCQYEKICREHGCKAKIFVKESGTFRQCGIIDQSFKRILCRMKGEPGC